jgi:hypothetical protein
MYTPRHMRRGKTNKSGPGKAEKSKAFRGAALHSKMFIYQKASALQNSKLNSAYLEWCAKAERGNLRKS